MTGVRNKNFIAGKLVAAFRRYRWMILAAALLGGSAGIWLGRCMAREVYAAKALLLIWADAGTDSTSTHSADRIVLNQDSYRNIVHYPDKYRELLLDAARAKTLPPVDLKKLLEHSAAECPECDGDRVCRSYIVEHKLDNALLAEISSHCGSRSGAWKKLQNLIAAFTQLAEGEYALRCMPVFSDTASVQIAGRVWLWMTAGGVCGGIAAGMAGLFLACFLFVNDQCISRLREFEKETNLPVLGVLPEVHKSFGIWRKLLEDPEYLRAMRSLYITVRYAFKQSRRARVCMITSMKRGNGKSSVVAALARVAADGGARVLIVDSNWRDPAQAKMFRQTGAEGLREFIAHKKTFDQLVIRNVMNNVDLLACGRHYVRQTMLINYRQLEDLLLSQTANYDLILLDISELQGVSDPLIVGRAADHRILVCDSRRTNRNKLAMGCWRMDKAGVRPDGVIVNFFPAEKLRREYELYQYCYSEQI